MEISHKQTWHFLPPAAASWGSASHISSGNAALTDLMVFFVNANLVYILIHNFRKPGVASTWRSLAAPTGGRPAGFPSPGS